MGSVKMYCLCVGKLTLPLCSCKKNRKNYEQKKKDKSTK